jgi:hypothetical protein
MRPPLRSISYMNFRESPTGEVRRIPLVRSSLYREIPRDARDPSEEEEEEEEVASLLNGGYTLASLAKKRGGQGMLS